MKKTILFLFLMHAFILPHAAQAENDFKESVLLILKVNSETISVKLASRKSFAFNVINTENADNNARLVLISKDDEALYSQTFSDRFYAGEDGLSSNTPLHGMAKQKQSEFILKIPYLKNAVSIQFERKNIKTGEMQFVSSSPLLNL